MDMWSVEDRYQAQRCCRRIERDTIGGLHPSRTACRVPALEMLLHTASVLPDSDENAKHSKPLRP
jgi:hypothetical protein